MPFDGNISVITIDRMIAYFERPGSWSKGVLYKGNSHDPNEACLKGVLNLMVYGDARNRPWFRYQSPEWTRINAMMKALARASHKRSHYTCVNDDIFMSRYDAINFLLITRRCIQDGDFGAPRLPARSSLFCSAQ
jgi:hypothetical protein